MIELEPGLRSVLDRLTERGGRPIIVGGAVRDELLKVASKDIDIECYSLDYETVARALTGLASMSSAPRSES